MQSRWMVGWIISELSRHSSHIPQHVTVRYGKLLVQAKGVFTFVEFIFSFFSSALLQYLFTVQFFFTFLWYPSDYVVQWCLDSQREWKLNAREQKQLSNCFNKKIIAMKWIFLVALHFICMFDCFFYFVHLSELRMWLRRCIAYKTRKYLCMNRKILVLFWVC